MDPFAEVFLNQYKLVCKDQAVLIDKLMAIIKEKDQLLSEYLEEFKNCKKDIKEITERYTQIIEYKDVLIKNMMTPQPN